MKKTILTASLLLAIHFFVNAQIVASVNTENKFVCNDTKTCQPGIHSNSNMTGMKEFNVSEPISDYDRYMKKSYNKNTAAWILVSGGALCTVIGVINLSQAPLYIWDSNEQKKAENKANFGGTLAIIGIAAMLGSIPLFISSSIYKSKARLIISNQKTGFGIPHKYGKELTGVTLSIPIGR